MKFKGHKKWLSMRRVIENVNNFAIYTKDVRYVYWCILWFAANWLSEMTETCSGLLYNMTMAGVQLDNIPAPILFWGFHLPLALRGGFIYGLSGWWHFRSQETEIWKLHEHHEVTDYILSKKRNLCWGVLTWIDIKCSVIIDCGKLVSPLGINYPTTSNIDQAKNI